MGAYGVVARVGSEQATADRPDRGKGAKWAFMLSPSQSRANRIFPPTGALFKGADPTEYVYSFDRCAVYRLYGRRAKWPYFVLKKQSTPD